ncbi:MAG: TonB-dependent receptor [Bacteroidota bacterium]
MRRARWLFSCVMVWISCQELAAQSDIRVYEEFRNTPLAEAFRSLQSSYGLGFNYVDEQVRNKVIYVDIINRPPREAVDLLLAGTGLSWTYVEARKIFLIRSEQDVGTESSELAHSLMIVKGRITDWDNKDGLMAGIRDVDSKQGTLADSMGYFELRLEQPSANLTLEVRHIGYQDYTVTLDPSSSLLNLQIRLKPFPVEIESVLIERRQEPPVALETGTQEIQIRPQKFGAVSGLGENDMMRAVQILPGVTSADESASELHVRGGRPEHNLLLFDGITMYQPGHFFGMVGSFNSEAVEEVRIQRGGFGARYGGRLASVIEVRTKPQKPDSLRLAAGMNALNGQFVVEVPFAKSRNGHKAAFLLAARRSTTDLINTWLYQNIFDKVFQQGIIYDNLKHNKQFRSQQVRMNPKFYFGDINAKAIFQPGTKDNLSISVFGGTDRLDYESIMPQGNSDVLVTDLDHLSLRNRGISASWERDWTEELRSESNVSYSSFVQNYGYVSETKDADSNGYVLDFQEQNVIQDLTIRQHLSWQPHPFHQIEGGWQFNRLGTRQGLSYHQQNFHEEHPLTLRNDVFLDSALLHHSYLQYAYQPSTPLSFKAGLRHTYFSHTNQHYLAPRISVKFALTDHWFLKAAYGQYRQYIGRIDVPNQLRVGEDFWMLADGDSIPVAEAKHIISGLSYQTKDMLLDIEIYHKELTDLTTYTQQYFRGGSELRNGYLVNDGTGTAIGLDLFFKKTFSIPGGTFTGLLSYSLSKVMYSFPDIEAARPYFANHDQRHIAKWANTLRIGRWDLSTNWTFASGRPYTPATGIQTDNYSHSRFTVIPTFGEINSARLPLYHRLDVSAAYKFSFLSDRRQGNIGISVFNVYNRNNVKSREFMAIRSFDSEDDEPQLVAIDRLLLGLSPNLFLNLHF